MALIDPLSLAAEFLWVAPRRVCLPRVFWQEEVNIDWAGQQGPRCGNGPVTMTFHRAEQLDLVSVGVGPAWRQS